MWGPGKFVTFSIPTKRRHWVKNTIVCQQYHTRKPDPVGVKRAPFFEHTMACEKFSLCWCRTACRRKLQPESASSSWFNILVKLSVSVFSSPSTVQEATFFSVNNMLKWLWCDCDTHDWLESAPATLSMDNWARTSRGTVSSGNLLLMTSHSAFRLVTSQSCCKKHRLLAKRSTNWTWCSHPIIVPNVFERYYFCFTCTTSSKHTTLWHFWHCKYVNVNTCSVGSTLVSFSYRHKKMDVLSPQGLNLVVSFLTAVQNHLVSFLQLWTKWKS